MVNLVVCANFHECFCHNTRGLKINLVVCRNCANFHAFVTILLLSSTIIMYVCEMCGGELRGGVGWCWSLHKLIDNLCTYMQLRIFVCVHYHLLLVTKDVALCLEAIIIGHSDW